MKKRDRPFEERVREDRADCIYDRFVDAIVTGHLKSGAKLPTMQRIAEENGVTFRVARGVVERLGREGYVKSYPHRGTVVRAKKHTVWCGRVLFVSFDDDSSSYFVTRIADALRRRLVAEGYLMAPVVASRAPRGDVSQLKTARGGAWQVRPATRSCGGSRPVSRGAILRRCRRRGRGAAALWKPGVCDILQIGDWCL